MALLDNMGNCCFGALRCKSQRDSRIGMREGHPGSPTASEAGRTARACGWGCSLRGVAL